MNEVLNSGAYQLFIKIAKSVIIEIGSLGKYKFEKGIYVYTGSAMKNLKQRTARHERLAKTKDKSKLRWHIDYLLTNKYVHLVEIKLFPSTEREECNINQALLNQENAIAPIKKFGSSDCKVCEAHLIYLGMEHEN